MPEKPEIYMEMVRQLYKSGAQLNLISQNGRYPLDLAYELLEKHDDHLMLDVLIEIGEYKRAIY
jgi:hypothetical protein